jgi:hypothetical protein
MTPFEKPTDPRKQCAYCQFITKDILKVTNKQPEDPAYIGEVWKGPTCRICCPHRSSLNPIV